MLDINLLRNDIKQVATNVAGKKVTLNIETFQHLEAIRRQLQIDLEALQAKRNSLSKQIGVLKSKQQDSSHIMQQVAIIGDSLNQTETEFNQINQQLQDFLYTLPNLVDSSVPNGSSELDNKLIRTCGVVREFDFVIKDHVELGAILNNQIDFDTASKISGSRFSILKGQIAKLHRILGQFMLDVHTQQHGYSETYVPYLLNSASMLGTGQLPKFEGDLFKTYLGNKPFYLIPTAEVPLTNMFSNALLSNKSLPLKFVAHSPCFRSEAGSYGRDTRGMIRAHQFDKVELVQIVQPQDSFSALEELTHHAETILKLLELPFRTMLLCNADTGFSSAKTYDIEVWIPSQGAYREISSCSNMTDYQTRRISARYKNEQGKNQLLHSLNGSGLAVGRTLVAILENYQNADGSITIPHALRDLMKCDIIEPNKD